jgi:hypothetical protein
MFAASLFVTGTSAAVEEKVLHNFIGGTDGTTPYSGLIFMPPAISTARPTREAL